MAASESCRPSTHTLVLVAPPGVDLLEVTVTEYDRMPVRHMLGICSVYAHAETTVQKRRDSRWLLRLLQRGQWEHPEVLTVDFDDEERISKLNQN